MTPPTPPLGPDSAETFQSDLEQSVRVLQSALVELMASVNADPAVPQEVARRFKLNKNLTWKVSRIVRGRDAYRVVQHLPGSAGQKIFLEALAKAGAPEERINRVREALAGFESMAKRHAGDKGNLSLLVSSSGADPEGYEARRREAFIGNSAIYGVQAQAAFAFHVLAPSKQDPTRDDSVSVSGFVGFRRLRPTAVWPLYSVGVVLDDVEASTSKQIPLDPTVTPGGSPFLRDFSSAETPELNVYQRDNEEVHELPEGPVGSTAAFHCAFGALRRAYLPIAVPEDDSTGEHYLPLRTPVEVAQFDLYVHKDLPWSMPPKVHLHSMLHGVRAFPLSRQHSMSLPLTSRVTDLGSPPVTTSLHVPDYSEMVGLACERLEVDKGQLRGFRVVVTYPPLPSYLVLHHPLGKL